MKLSIHFCLLFVLSISHLQLAASKYDSYKGLVMAGYQGWFNTLTDGANRGWYHYQKNFTFKPGACSIDMWPDMSEYQEKYPTDFKFADGSAAYVFSSYDESTIDLHFKWMKEYNIDGVFLQRFIVTLKTESGRMHAHKVLKAAIKAAQKYERVLGVMYDLSGMIEEDYSILIDDWKNIIEEFHINDRTKYSNFLFHNDKPLVAVWGVGFNDNRQYGFGAVNKIIDFLKDNEINCSVLLGVPTYWRTLSIDTVNDLELHQIIKKVDIVHPWFVGRFNENTYNEFNPLITEDLEWCKKNNLDYVPTVFPGFSWYNMKSGAEFNQIPRNKGDFMWKQFAGAIQAGSEMIYVAMFDEIDEATAIFKIAHEVPVGDSKFVAVEKDIKTDHYLWLTGMANNMLNRVIPFTLQQPNREIVSP